VGISLIIIFGWIAGVDAIKNPFPNFPITSLFTAISITIGSVLLCAYVKSNQPSLMELAEMAEWVCLILLIIISIPFLAANLFSINTGIQELFSPRIIQGLMVNPSIPSSGSTISILLFTIIAFLSTLNSRAKHVVITFSAAGVGIIAVIALIGYALGQKSMYYLTAHSAGMSIVTALLFLVLAIGFILESRHQRKDLDLTLVQRVSK
jgi:hypothetical protein